MSQRHFKFSIPQTELFISPPLLSHLLLQCSLAQWMAPSLIICPSHKSTLHLIGWVTFLKHKPVYSTTSLVIIFNPILGFCFSLWSHFLALPVCPLPSTNNKRHVVLCTGPEVLCLCVFIQAVTLPGGAPSSTSALYLLILQDSA